MSGLDGTAPGERLGRGWLSRLPRPSLAGAWAVLRSESSDQLAYGMLWAPIAFGAGSAAYFALKFEPGIWICVAIAACALTVAGISRYAGPSRALAVVTGLMAFIAVGGLAAKIRTVQVDAPVLTETGPRFIEGWVVDVASPGVSGERVVLAPVYVSGLEPEATPNRIRVTLPQGELPAPGAPVRLTAIVGPPPPPASPGAYDFARDAFFEGIGGVGFSRALPAATDLEPPPARLRLIMRINAARWALGRRIAAIVGPGAAGLAVAMTTGHETFVTEADEQALRDSGLAHIISISGLHMAIVGGFAFFAVRALIAAVPAIALRFPGKKIAAVAGLAAVTGYLVLSGAPSPAQRAAITAGVAFIAILFDRKAVTLHSLALAALAILVLQPDAVMDPGFQMSFSATAALVALFEAWRRPVREISAPWPIRLFQDAMTWLALSLGASFVAGLATAPIAMQHFNRVSTYGLASNLAAEPISTFLVMPFLALGALLTPIGFGAPFLAIAGFGIEVIQTIAAWFAGLPGAVALVPSAPAAALPVALVGVLFMCLWKGRLRWLGLPLAFAVMLWPRPPSPDVWVADDGAAAAIRTEGRALALRPTARAFAADLWARRRGLVLEDGSARADCNRNRCLVRPGTTDIRLSGWWTHRRISEAQMTVLCRNAEVVVVRALAPPAVPGCAGAFVLDGRDFERGGSAELYRAGAGWRVVWAEDIRGRRPWTGPPDRGEARVSDTGG